jgi:ankyrin repeat protein
MCQNHCFSYEVREVVGLGTPLYEAARMGRISGVKRGAYYWIRNSDGKTALEVAEREQNLAVADEIRLLGTPP